MQLYVPHELAFRTQYAELKERSRAATALLAGTPGTLVPRSGTGRTYWYRVHQSPAGVQVEDLVCKDGDDASLSAARAELEFAAWAAAQVRDLRKLGFQVADKGVAGVLVELHKRGLLAKGLCLVGTLAYMATLNEYGARAVSARTQDIDLAARQPLRLGAPHAWADTLQATRMPFFPVPGLARGAPSSAFKLHGSDGLRVDLLTHGQRLGTLVPLPELAWHAQAVPHFDYLLDKPDSAALLAGGHCIPLRVPRPERMLWHKLYASAKRRGAPEKAAKDLLQAATLAAVLVEREDFPLADSFAQLPAAMKSTARQRLPALRRALAAHPAAEQALSEALAT